ncbi:MAG: peptide deformylase [Deltaproteobacteria bacterium]|nr:peptide deformylase [Deltaproteobacteria bacterium]
MATREILIWPDKRLAQKCVAVADVNDDIRALARDMLESMYQANGVGLAAPQVGVLKRMVVIDLQGRDGAPSGEPPLVLINPVFNDMQGELTWEEGCLSVPNEVGQVTRYARCVVDYTDLDGKPQRVTGEGLASVALQHECDHLEGKLFVDYLSPIKRNVIRRRMLKLKAERERNRPVQAAAL